MKENQTPGWPLLIGLIAAIACCGGPVLISALASAGIAAVFLSHMTVVLLGVGVVLIVFAAVLFLSRYVQGR